MISFLRGTKSGIKNRTGVLNGKRIDYFKGTSYLPEPIPVSHCWLFYCLCVFPGKAAVKALLSPAYSTLKNVPKITTETEAMAHLQQTLPYAFYLRVDRQQAQGSSKQLNFSQQQMFTPDGYFAWFYEGSQWTTYVGGVAMVAVMLAGVMFPLWPSTLRLGVWYLSILVLALIGVFFGIAIVRLILYIITVVVAPPGLWIFPQLFADVGFVGTSFSHPCGPGKLTRFHQVDSFIPLYEWDFPKKKKGKKVKSSDKGKGKEKERNSGTEQSRSAYVEEIEDSESSRPVSRNAMVADVADEST